MIDEKLLKVIKKKAFGFSYTESQEEYETTRPKNLLFCERKNRVISSKGFVAVRKIIKKNEVVGLEIRRKIKGFRTYPMSKLKKS